MVIVDLYVGKYTDMFFLLWWWPPYLRTTGIVQACDVVANHGQLARERGQRGLGRGGVAMKLQECLPAKADVNEQFENV